MTDGTCKQPIQFKSVAGPNELSVDLIVDERGVVLKTDRLDSHLISSFVLRVLPHVAPGRDFSFAEIVDHSSGRTVNTPAYPLFIEWAGQLFRAHVYTMALPDDAGQYTVGAEAIYSLQLDAAS